MRRIRSKVDYRDFHGLVTNVDPQDRPPGSTVIQDNITCITPGELRVRKGMRDVVWAGDGSNLTLNGTTDGAFVTTSNYRAADSNGTVVCRFKTDASGGGNRIIWATSDEASDINYVIIYIDTNGKLVIGHRNVGDLDAVETTGTYNDDLWHHAAFVADTSNYRIVVDGSEETLSVVAGSDSGLWVDQTPTQRDNVTIGFWRALSGDTLFFDGIISQVAAYSTALTTATIQTDRTAGIPSTTNMVSLWNVNEGSGTLLKDDKGTLDMTVLGTPTWSPGKDPTSKVITLRHTPRPDGEYALIFNSAGKIKLKHTPT
jgi:hypothetical protein